MKKYNLVTAEIEIQATILSELIIKNSDSEETKTLILRCFRRKPIN